MAAADNARWCDAVCRTHGIDTERDGRAWTAPTRTPPLYPDAITLVTDVSPSEILSRIDASPGCSVKDSFCSLDLTGHGFHVLFDAQWIVRRPSDPAPSAAGGHWTVVRDRETFADWERAWRARDGPLDVLRPALLRSEDTTVLAAWADHRIVGGAALHRSATVLGISNFFSEGSTTAESWQGCLALSDAMFPGVPLVGYLSGSALEVACTHGFEVVGPLRVWLRD